MSGLLVIDDDFAVLETLALLLEGEGYRVRKAGDGAEALARLAEETAELVICDVVMPVMDGPTLVARMGSDPRLAAIPVLFLTGAHRNPLVLAPRVVGTLRKPFLFDALLRMVHAVLPPPPEPPRVG